jgi:transcriptional repressor NrdR
MNCPKCNHAEDKVVDSRMSKNGLSIRRRRECLDCGNRFTTIEEVVPSEIFVIKRDGSREDFNPQKLRDGIEKACYKLTVNEEQLDELVSSIIRQIEQLGKTEVSVEDIGAAAMSELESFNDVAYVRFASVYREFKDIDQFIKEIQMLNKKQG